MGTQQSNPAGPDLAAGVPIDDLPHGHMLVGHVGEDAVLLARRGSHRVQTLAGHIATRKCQDDKQDQARDKVASQTVRAFRRQESVLPDQEKSR